MAQITSGISSVASASDTIHDKGHSCQLYNIRRRGGLCPSRLTRHRPRERTERSRHGPRSGPDFDRKWRRRESNPRPRPHRQSVYKLRLPFRFARRPVDSRPTAGLVILWCRASGDDIPLAPSPLVDAADRATGRARGDAPHYGLSSESECVIVIRTCVVFPVVLRGRPGTSACNSAGEPTTSKPGRPRMSGHIVAAALPGKNLGQDARPSHDHRRRLSRRR